MPGIFLCLVFGGLRRRQGFVLQRHSFVDGLRARLRNGAPIVRGARERLECYVIFRHDEIVGRKERKGRKIGIRLSPSRPGSSPPAACVFLPLPRRLGAGRFRCPWPVRLSTHHAMGETSDFARIHVCTAAGGFRRLASLGTAVDSATPASLCS